MANEKRLIDADAALEKIANPHYQKCGTKKVTASALVWATALINNAPTVDAVEVVRCRDCEHFCFDHTHYCELDDGLPTPSPGDFCSYGERKDNDG